MSNWTNDELKKIAAADDLHIAPFREDGKTYGTLTWIWSVVVDGGLYVRPYHGHESRWYRAAIQQKAGKITVAGLTREVNFEPASAAIIDRVDVAYKTKYAASPYLKPMIVGDPRATTVKIIPV